MGAPHPLGAGSAIGLVVIGQASTHDHVAGGDLVGGRCAQEGHGSGDVLRPFEALQDDMPRLEKIWADGGYTGKLADYLLGCLGWDLEIITPTKAEPGFHVRPWCWIVERTFGWLTKHRRLSKDYERSTAASEALIRAYSHFKRY